MGEDTRDGWITSTGMDVIKAAVEGDKAACKDLLRRVLARYGTGGIYQLCCGLAETIAVLAGMERAPDGFWGFEVFNRAGVEVGAADPSVADQAAVRAMQFVMAQVNEDAAQRVALFDADLQTGKPTIPGGLIILVAVYGRRREAEHKAGQS